MYEKIIDDDLLQQCIDAWGRDNQIEMIKEECMELALALQKLKRTGDKQEQLLAIVDEIADVALMLEQAKFIFPEDLIKQRIEFKLNRLRERLSKGYKL